ncbi:hypothetical protein F9Z52_06125, partial [Escherichia coli]
YLVEQIKDLESQLKRKLDEDEVGQRLLSNRGYFDLAGRNGSQIDLKTWIQYRADKAPVVLREEELPFNC